MVPVTVRSAVWGPALAELTAKARARGSSNSHVILEFRIVSGFL